MITARSGRAHPVRAAAGFAGASPLNYTRALRTARGGLPMTARTHAVALLAAGLSLVALRASAHHSVYAEFDRDRHVTLVGVICEIEWVYPHTHFEIDVLDHGNVERWRLESLPTAMFHKIGLSRSKLMDGETVTIEALRSRKAGERFGWILSVRYPDGTRYQVDDS